MPEIVVAMEAFDQFWPDARPLAEAHALEVDGGVEPRRRFKLDEAAARGLEAAGMLKIFTARIAGRMVGYFTWNVVPDVESDGLLIGLQGAWYVAPGHPKAAVRLWDVSVSALRSAGVKCLFPHHRAQGRGANLGRFFRRRGAKPIQTTYSCWIGSD